MKHLLVKGQNVKINLCQKLYAVEFLDFIAIPFFENIDLFGFCAIFGRKNPKLQRRITFKRQFILTFCKKDLFLDLSYKPNMIFLTLTPPPIALSQGG